MFIACEQCGTELDVSGYRPGQKGKCPECGALLVVPGPAAERPPLREVLPPVPEPEPEPDEPEPETEPEPGPPAAAGAGSEEEEEPSAAGPQSLWLGVVVLIVGLIIVAAAFNYFFGSSAETPATVASGPGDSAAVLPVPLAGQTVAAARPETAAVRTPPAPVPAPPPAAAPARPAPVPAAAPAPAARPATAVPAPPAPTPAVRPAPAAPTPAPRSSGTITVKILNATGVDGLAAELERKLEQANPNIRVISVGTHAGASVETVVYDKHYRMDATQTVQRALGLGRVTQNPDNDNRYPYDVLVVIGTDYLRR